MPSFKARREPSSSATTVQACQLTSPKIFYSEVAAASSLPLWELIIQTIK